MNGSAKHASAREWRPQPSRPCHTGAGPRCIPRRRGPLHAPVLSVASVTVETSSVLLRGLCSYSDAHRPVDPAGRRHAGDRKRWSASRTCITQVRLPRLCRLGDVPALGCGPRLKQPPVLDPLVRPQRAPPPRGHEHPDRLIRGISARGIRGSRSLGHTNKTTGRIGHSPRPGRR